MKHLPLISDFYQNKSIALNACDYHTPLINSDQSNIEVMYSTIYFAWFAFEHVLKQNPLSENKKILILRMHTITKDTSITIKKTENS